MPQLLSTSFRSPTTPIYLPVGGDLCMQSGSFSRFSPRNPMFCFLKLKLEVDYSRFCLSACRPSKAWHPDHICFGRTGSCFTGSMSQSSWTLFLPNVFLTLRVDRRPHLPFFFGRLGKDCWSGQGRSGVVSKEMACLPQHFGRAVWGSVSAFQLLNSHYVEQFCT